MKKEAQVLWCSACQDGRQWPHKTGEHTDLGVCFALRPAIFEIQQGCWKLEIHQIAPELLEAFKFTSILYTLNTHPWGPNITLFCSMISHFQETRLSKIRNGPKWPQNDLNHLSVKVPCIHWILTPEAQISLRFALRWPFSRYNLAEKS